MQKEPPKFDIMHNNTCHILDLSYNRYLLLIPQGVDQTVVERDYIRDETRKLFKANASLTEEKDISDRVSIMS